jgi:hypothetical protein
MHVCRCTGAPGLMSQIAHDVSSDEAHIWLRWHSERSYTGTYIALIHLAAAVFSPSIRYRHRYLSSSAQRLTMINASFSLHCVCVGQKPRLGEVFCKVAHMGDLRVYGRTDRD